MRYKRYGNSSSVPNFDDNNNGNAVSNGILKNSSGKEIYFGIAKPRKSDNFRDLQSSDFTKGIQSDTDECTATLTVITDKLNIGQIRYNLSANTSGSVRNIVFKYNNIDLFHITQRSQEVVDNNTYVYLREYNYQYDTCIVCASSDYIGFSDTVIPDSAKEIFLEGTRGQNLYYHVSNNKESTISLIGNKSISSLISSGVLTYVSGRNFNSATQNLIKAPTKMLSSFTYNNNSLSINLEEVKDNSIMYIFGGDSDATKGGQADLNYINETIDWSNIINDNNETSVGKYKLNNNNNNNIVFSISAINNAQTIVISWGSTNFSTDGTTIQCKVNDWTPNDQGQYYAQFSIDIPSGYGNSIITVPSSKGSFYKNHQYSLIGPCTPASYNGYNFSVSSKKFTYGSTIGL